jgi:YjbR
MKFAAGDDGVSQHREECMSVDAARARELALALSLASEAPHFDRLAFRTPRKIFATLNARAGDLNLMFDPDLRDFYCEQAPHAFTPVPGGWGRKGATRCDLAQVDEATLMSALRAAHQLAAPKAKGR